MSKHRLLPLVACALSAFLLSGCGGEAEVTISRNAPDAGGAASSSQGSSPDVPTSAGVVRDNSQNQEEPNEADSAARGSSTPVVTAVDAQPDSRGGTDATDSSPGGSPSSPPSTDSEDDAPNVATTIPPSDYRVSLPSGQTLDIKALLDDQRAEFEKRFEGVLTGKSLLRTYYEVESEESEEDSTGKGGSSEPPTGATGRQENQPQEPVIDRSKPFMFISRINGVLRGPTIAYYRDGTPMFYATYDRDSRRDGTLISWDELGRPIVLDQFTAGKRDGLRVLFRSRGEKDPTGRVVLVQEWQRDGVVATHLVTSGNAETGEKTLTFDGGDVSADPDNDELADALAELDEFDRSLTENEVELRKALAELHRNEVKAAKAIEAAIKNSARKRARAAAVQARMQIVDRLRSSIQSPGDFRSNYRDRRFR